MPARLGYSKRTPSRDPFQQPPVVRYVHCGGHLESLPFRRNTQCVNKGDHVPTAMADSCGVGKLGLCRSRSRNGVLRTVAVRVGRDGCVIRIIGAYFTPATPVLEGVRGLTARSSYLRTRSRGPKRTRRVTGYQSTVQRAILR